ncbi:molybdopterin-binding protein [Homoserinibacter sp. GY 40078]|uniref:TOBE domain-containing protein n=1 Tax=Homoserinibacter sp. GY 40078 TaxID=2603275 RepID=UPI0011CC323E|nr:TOBE domain-containing protein [Homoserinibacter sp. GY 40078]TXK18572.1 helix-turn-helix domain-containing protein [Homoserinibacter sp. GY 40078]
MSGFSVREAASLLGVSDDTVRRWAEAGRLSITTPPGGRQTIDGIELAQLAEELAAEARRGAEFPGTAMSSRNRFTGLITRVQRDGVMAQVDIQAGPFRVVSLMTREAADELALEPGMLASAVVKATSVSVQLPGGGA